METKIIIKRFDPKIKKFYLREYKVSYDKDTVLLDALIYIKENIDRSLSFRYSCRMANCGSCGMVANKKPVLACETRIEELNKPIYVEPLYNFKVIKDLVVDIEVFMKKLKEIEPYIIKEKEDLEFKEEYIVYPEQLDLFKQASSCINCMLCYSACPVFASDEKFLGPAAISLIYRYLMDPRDEMKEKRLKISSLENSIWQCSFVGECSVVCPKNVDPSFSIQRLKLLNAINIIKLIFKGK